MADAKNIVGGLAQSLAGGVAAASGADIFDKFMQTVRERGDKPMSDSAKKVNFGKIRLAALGHDVSDIQDENDLALKEAQLEHQAEQFNQSVAQFNEMVDVADATVSQWRAQETPVEPDQIAGFLQTKDQAATLRGRLEKFAPPGANMSTYDFRLSAVERGYEEAKALSDARTAGTLAAQGKYDELAKVITGTPPNSRAYTETLRNAQVQNTLAGAQAAHQAVAGMRKVGDEFVGPVNAIELRALLSDEDGIPLPWAKVQGNPELLKAAMKAGADPQFGQNIEDAHTAYTAEADEAAARDVLGGFGIETAESAPDDYRTQSGEFDRARFYRDVFDTKVQEAETMAPAELARLAVNMQSMVEGQRGDPATAVISDHLQRVNQILLERYEGEPEAIAQVQEAEAEATTGAFMAFLDESLGEGELIPDMAAAFPLSVTSSRVSSSALDPAFSQEVTTRRAPKNYEERVAALNQVAADIKAGRQVPPAQRSFFESFSRMSPEAGYEFLVTGKAPEFDAGRAKNLFINAVMPPKIQVDYAGLGAQMRTVAKTLSAAGLGEAAASAEEQAEYYKELEYGRDVGAKGIRTVGLALGAYAQSGSIDDVVTRVAGDYPASAQQQLTGQSDIDRLGLKNAEEELASAEGTGQKARILLRNVENAIYNAAGLQFGTEGERSVARGEAQIVFARIREQLDALIDYQERAGLSDAQMARKMGGEGDDWVGPLFEAFGEVSLGL